MEFSGGCAGGNEHPVYRGRTLRFTPEAVPGGTKVSKVARMRPASLVWLFDVDGTLLLTQGAGRMAIAAALRERFGIEDDLAHVAFAGRTDPLIVADALRPHGLEPDGDPLWDTIAAQMRRLMDPPRGGLLPGVPALLDAIAAEPAWVLALLTGNVHEMARIKLDAFGVYERFAFGAFGDEAADRDALAIVAVERAAQRHGVTPARCIVVGDTEHDIACARAAGAHAVAVATGSRTRAELAARSPDLLLDDLTDAAALVRWARALG
jgi:phosphoglycolate phosphatase-like HAD superfamily hydrolase